MANFFLTLKKLTKLIRSTVFCALFFDRYIIQSRHFLAILALTGFCSTFTTQAALNKNTAFSINVYAEASSALVAKRDAIRHGLWQAWQSFLATHIRYKTQKLLKKRVAEELQSPELFLKGQQIFNEKISSKSYKATVKFIFDLKKFKKFLKDSNIPYVQISPLSLLVVPLTVENGHLHIWGEKNSALSQLADYDFNSPALEVHFPAGSESDLSTFNDTLTTAPVKSQLEALLKQYYKKSGICLIFHTPKAYTPSDQTKSNSLVDSSQKLIYTATLVPVNIAFMSQQNVSITVDAHTEKVKALKTLLNHILTETLVAYQAQFETAELPNKNQFFRVEFKTFQEFLAMQKKIQRREKERQCFPRHIAKNEAVFFCTEEEF